MLHDLAVKIFKTIFIKKYSFSKKFFSRKIEELIEY